MTNALHKTYNFYFYYKQGDDFQHHLEGAAKIEPDKTKITATAFRLWSEQLKVAHEQCLALANACDGQIVEGDGGANCTFLRAEGEKAIAALDALANDPDSSIEVDTLPEEAEDSFDLFDKSNYVFWNGNDAINEGHINLFVAETEEHARLIVTKYENDDVTTNSMLFVFVRAETDHIHETEYEGDIPIFHIPMALKRDDLISSFIEFLYEDEDDKEVLNA